MQIIEKMPDEQFETICDAGVDLVKELVAVLNRHGLGLEQATSVLAVAAAGIAKGSNVKLTEFLEAAELVQPMWREENRGGQQGLVFDPAHRRIDLVPQVRDTSTEN